MEKTTIDLKSMKMIGQMLNYKYSIKYGVMNLKDGSEMTTELHIFETPEGPVFLNLSNAITYKFESKEKFDKFISKKVKKMYKSEKAMYMEFNGWTEEIWNAWNGNGEEE